MKKQNKLISFIFAIVIILTLFIPNTLQANTSSDSFNESIVSAISIKETITGLAPFDNNNNVGNDSSPNNNIVRSFDNINYTLEYITQLKNNNPISDANLCIEFILPCTKNIATFDLNTMTWLVDSKIEEKNGMQILTGKRFLQNNSEDNAIPGEGTLSVGIKVQAAPNGTKIQPEFKLYMEGNNVSEAQIIKSEEITVSAAPKYNVQLRRNSYVNYRGYYDPSTGTGSLEKNDNSIHGRMQGYAITIQLYNDSASKGLKGIEIPQGNIEFDITFKEETSLDGSSDLTFTEGYTPYFWDYNENTGRQTGFAERIMYWRGDPRSYTGNLISPYGGGNRTVTHNKCYYGGDWDISQIDVNKYHVIINNYEFSPEFIFPTTNVENLSSVKSYGLNIGCFSAGYFQAICAFPDNVQNTTNIYMTVETSNFKSSSISNQAGIDVYSSDNKVTTNITLYPPGSISKSIQLLTAKSEWMETASNWNTDAKGSMFVGEPFLARLNVSQSNYDSIQSYNTLFKFDDKGLEPTPDIYHSSTTWRATESYGQVTILFAAKPDKTGWKNYSEMIVAQEEDLIYFKTLEELLNKGYTPIGALVEGRNANVLEGVHNYLKIKLKDDAAIKQTFGMVTNLRAWTDKITFSYANLEYDFQNNTYPKINTTDKYVANYPIPTGTVNTTSYVKTEYDENGEVIPGTHAGGYLNGNTILCIDYKAELTKTIASLSPDGSIKTIFDMDANERIIKYNITPKTIMKANSSGNKTTTLYIIDNLPKDLKYIEGTSFWNNQPLEPTITINSDGTSKLEWILKDVIVGTQLNPIEFDCIIGKAGTNQDVQNNQIISNTATITGESDKRNHSLQNNNISTVSFNVIKLNAISISKTTNTPYINLGQDFNFTLKYANNSENALPNSKIYDILPYKNDGRDSDFEGFYKINNITINFINAPKTFNDFVNNNHIVGYTTNKNIPVNDFSTISAINNWTEITNKSINTTNKTITYSNLPENITGLIFNMNLEGLEYIEITINITPTGNQEEGDIYVNDFYQYSNGQIEQVHSNHVVVQVYGHLDITKIWQDDNNKYNTRPNNLDITIFQDGNKYKTITLNSNNTIENFSYKWTQKVENIPLFDTLGNPHIYEIQEDYSNINSNFYYDAIYDQKTLTVTNIGVWIKNNSLPEYFISVSKDIINNDNQLISTEDLEKIKLNTNDIFEFPIILKELNRTITNNGTFLVETYSGYSGNEYHGIVTKDKQLIFRNIPAGKYEISEESVQYFKFVDIKEIDKSENALFTKENGKYYITLSILHENNEFVEVKIINKIDNFRLYNKAINKENLFKMP